MGLLDQHTGHEPGLTTEKIVTFQMKVGTDLPKPTTARDVTVEALMVEAFSAGREPRSPEYRAGVRSILVHHIEGKELTVPYPPGSAQADAFFAGRYEGKAIWRRATGIFYPNVDGVARGV